MLKALRQLGSILDRRDLVRLTGVLLAILVMSVLEVVGIASILPFMRVVAEPELIRTNETLSSIQSTLGFTTDRQMLIAMGAVVLGLFALSTAFNAYTQWLIQRRIWSMAHDICMKLLQTYARIPYSYFLTSSSSDLLKKAIADVNNLVTGVLIAMSHLIAYSILSLVIFALLMWVNPLLSAAAIVVFGGAYSIIHISRSGYLRRLGKEHIESAQIRIRAFSETVSGMKAIRAEGVSPFFIARFEDASKRFTSIHPKFKLVTLVPRAAVEFLAFGGILAAILFMLVTERNFLDALPVLSVFTLASYRLLPALNKAFFAAAQLNHHLPVVDEVCRDIADAMEAETLEEGALTPIDFEREIRLESVNFEYASRSRVIEGLDLVIPKGTRCALVGPTGSGKTTIIDMLIGLLLPQEGSVCVDDERITLDNVVSWRRKVAYVPQDVFLYDDTITKNIAFGVAAESVDMDRVRRAASIAQIDQFIEGELPEGYDTVIGERGVRLSGGQRQRLGLARAFYRSPEVLLLDEATSALDGITEKAVMESIHAELPNLTIVMIAHRLSTIRLCDRIHLIEQGRLVAEGTYDELFETNETFRQMAKSTTWSSS